VLDKDGVKCFSQFGSAFGCGELSDVRLAFLMQGLSAAHGSLGHAAPLLFNLSA
jgi:hypothetical protein